MTPPTALNHQIQKEFNYDSNNASEENMYETPDEIGLLMVRKGAASRGVRETHSMGVSNKISQCQKLNHL